MGRHNALAAWFDIPKDANKAEQDFVREGILNEVYQYSKFGVSICDDKEVIIVETPKGRAIIEQETIQGCKLVWFDYVEKRIWSRIRFWMNLSSVEDLIHKIKSDCKKKVEFDTIFINECTR